MDKKIIEKKVGYANYPSVFLMDNVPNKAGAVKFRWVKQLLFGDRVTIKMGSDKQPLYQTFNNKQYVKVRSRGRDGYVLPKELLPDRPMEVNFIDVGQGDGCHIVTPDDKHFIIDAGASDNMFRFIKWRFNLGKKENQTPEITAIISHPDEDHYYGFHYIFKNKQVRIKEIFHNGLVEATGQHYNTLGTLVKNNGQDYISDLVDDTTMFEKRAATAKKGKYIKVLDSRKTVLKKALRKGLSDALNDNEKLKFEVLAPVAIDINGKPALPVFGSNKGKTKNGHSIVLKLTMGHLRLLLGGDLNSLAEDYLMQHYTDKDVARLRKDILAGATARQQDLDAAIKTAKAVFMVDIAKSCHHGSSDFTTEFMQAVNPIATIISSGDEEPHCHPRPDTLGTIGKHSRGERSLIFSTELARSTLEFLTTRNLASKQKKPNITINLAEELTKPVKLTKERVVTLYGMINVRTDGKRVIIAQKLEKTAARGAWDIHKLVWNPTLQEFEYKPQA